MYLFWLNKSISPERTRKFTINQFPFEAAFVQKDYLAREIQKQWGMPFPPWVIESYDLDVQLKEIIWIIWPAGGSQLKHVS